MKEQKNDDLKKLHGCIKLKELLTAESKIINRHLEDHKIKNNIKDKNIAISDFINKFAWVMKEIYCENVCEENCKCDVFLKIKNSDNI